MPGFDPCFRSLPRRRQDNPAPVEFAGQPWGEDEWRGVAGPRVGYGWLASIAATPGGVEGNYSH